MATPNVVPRADGEGSIGILPKRWGEGYFSGRVMSRGQTIPLKYFVSDQNSRYLLSGLPSSTRPEVGDMVYQTSPSLLFIVTDDTKLGNETGYYGIAPVTGLTGKIDAVSGTGNYTTLQFNNYSKLYPFTSGVNLNNPDEEVVIWHTELSNFHIDVPAYLNVYNIGTTGFVLTLVPNASGNLIQISHITTGQLNALSGITGNIQAWINDLFTGGIVSPAGDSYSIQWRNGDNFGGSPAFRYNTGGLFGYNTGPLRGAFDVRRDEPVSGHMSLLTGTLTVSYVAGSATRDGNYYYSVWPFKKISGLNYYHTGCFSGYTTIPNGTYDPDLTWDVQSGASGYRIYGSGSGLNTVNEITGTGVVFTDVGTSNTSGPPLPTLRGADLTLDIYGNLWLTGEMYINGHRVLTTGDSVTTTSVTGINVTGLTVTGVVTLTGVSGTTVTLTGQTVYITSSGVGSSPPTGVTGIHVTGVTATGRVEFTGVSGVKVVLNNQIISIMRTGMISGDRVYLGVPTDGAYGGPEGSIAGIVSGDHTEDALDKIDTILGLLAPAKPLNLSSATFGFSGTTFTANMEKTSSSYSNIVVGTPTGYATGFYNGSAGVLSGFLNGTLTGAKALSAASDIGTYTGLGIYQDADYWSGVAGKSGFWYYLNAYVKPLSALASGKFTMQMVHTTCGSTPLLTGYMDSPATPSVSILAVNTGVCTTRTIDGVPSLAANDPVWVSGNFSNVVTAFYRVPMAMFYSSYTSQPTVNATGTPASGSTLALSGSCTASNSVYATGITFTARAYNSTGLYSNTNSGTNIRIDTISTQQSERRLAGTGQWPANNYGDTYNDATSLTTNEELQMISGRLQYPPRVNYSLHRPAGPDYTTMPSGSWSGYRWACFNMGSISSKNAVTVTVNNSANFGSNAIVPNLAMYVTVSGSSPTIGWLDGNAQYPGGGNPTGNGAAALDTTSSTATSRRVTFGTNTLSGPVWVRMGIASGSTLNFGSITLSS